MNTCLAKWHKELKSLVNICLQYLLNEWDYSIFNVPHTNKYAFIIMKDVNCWQIVSLDLKHCQRHNVHEGWVLLTKVISLGHITNSYTNLDQTSSKSRPSTNFKISTKHQHFDKTSTYKSWPNIASESQPRMNFIATTKHQQQNND